MPASCSGCCCGTTPGSRRSGAWCACPRWNRRIGASCIASSGPGSRNARGWRIGSTAFSRPRVSGCRREPTSGPRPRRCACGTARPCPRRCGLGWSGEWEHAQFLRTRIRELERARQRAIAHGHGEALAKVRQLLRLRAVGPGSAWVYVNEFFGWRRFRNRKEVGAAAGLTPTPYQSGDERREQGISKAGSRHIRAVAIEMAWGWLRYQPRTRLSPWDQARFGRGGTPARKVGIVALARKLLIALWRFLEFGMVPEGARLKTG